VLSDALGAVAAALAKGVEPGDGTALVLPARGSPLDGYAAALMPLYLQREGWRQVRLFNGLQLDLPRGRELPLRLPAHAVFALRNAAQAVFVTADTDEAGVGGELQAALYDPAEGQRLVQARVPFSLPPSYRFLLCEVGRAWEPSDKEWLELLDELFAPANEEGLDFAARLTLAGGLYLFRQGFWKQSAEALLELCQPSANTLTAALCTRCGGGCSCMRAAPEMRSGCSSKAGFMTSHTRATTGMGGRWWRWREVRNRRPRKPSSRHPNYCRAKHLHTAGSPASIGTRPGWRKR